MYPIDLKMKDNIGPKLVKSILDWCTCKYIGINIHNGIKIMILVNIFVVMSKRKKSLYIAVIIAGDRRFIQRTSWRECKKGYYLRH